MQQPGSPKAQRVWVTKMAGLYSLWGKNSPGGGLEKFRVQGGVY